MTEVGRLPFLVEGVAGFTTRRAEEIREWHEDLTQRAGLADKLLERWGSMRSGSEVADSSIGGSVGVYNEVLYLILRAARPETVVETGVSFGFSSAYVLQALHDNGHGRLYSIDTPAPAPAPNPGESGEGGAPGGARVARESGAVVPDQLRYHWTIRRGRSELILPQLLDEVGPVDLFLHDSGDAENGTLEELRSAWSHLAPAGYVIADNLHRDEALAQFAAEVGVPSFRWIGPSGRCGGLRRPPG